MIPNYNNKSNNKSNIKSNDNSSNDGSDDSNDNKSNNKSNDNSSNGSNYSSDDDSNDLVDNTSLESRQDGGLTLTSSSNQSIFNSKFGIQGCILRTPTDLPTHENSSERQPLTAILQLRQSNTPNQHEPVETCKAVDETSGGKFGDKFSLHVEPAEGKNNLFTNRISYNTQTNAYYENGILSSIYLKKWEKGAYQWNNIKLKIEYDWKKTYLARIEDTSGNETSCDDGEISWKFDYRTGGFIIDSLNLRLSFGTFDNLARVCWFIKALPTMKNQNPTWQLIQFDPYTERRHQTNEINDVTQFVKNEYGFILRAYLSGGEESYIQWQKTQLFRQDWNGSTEGLYVENDETFGLDVKVELKPDIVLDNPLPSLPELFVFNDETTSDFVIHIEIQTGDNQSTESSSASNKKIRDFHVHSRVLSTSSDYFKALLDSRMIESQNKSLNLKNISYKYLEAILKYIYTGMLPNIMSYDEWVTLLRYASRFLVPTLIQRCEKELKSYLNYNNLDKVKEIASECGAEQLLRCCEGFEPPRND